MDDEEESTSTVQVLAPGTVFLERRHAIKTTMMFSHPGKKKSSLH